MTDLYESAALLLRFLFLLLGILILVRAAWMTVKDSARASSLRQNEEETGVIAHFVVVDRKGRGIEIPLLREGLVGTHRKADIRISGAGLEKKHFYYEIIDGGIVVTPLDGAFIKLEGKPEEMYDPETLRPGRIFFAGNVQFKYVVNLISVKPISPPLKRAYGSIADKILKR